MEAIGEGERYIEPEELSGWMIEAGRIALRFFRRREFEYIFLR